MSRFAVGPQGGQALQSPSYTTYKYTGTYTKTQLTTNLALLKRVMGQQRIVCTLAIAGTPYTFSFALTGGTNRPTTNALPMFPNLASTYSTLINYALDGQNTPPAGCTVEMLPIPSGGTASRINIFDVTETLSGSNYVFRFSLCPFLNIDSTIESTGPVLPDGTTLTVYSEFFRVTPDLRTEGKLISGMTPNYTTRLFNTLVPTNGAASPLDTPGTKVDFRRYPGQQTIVFTNLTTSYYFSIDLDYGIIGQANGYIGFTTSPTANCRTISTPVGCTVNSVAVSNANSNANSRVIRLEVTSPVSDGGGRVYTLEFSPYAYQKAAPTISLGSGAVLGNVDVNVGVYARYFSYV